MDRLYYKIYILYKNRFKSDIPGVYSVSFIVLLIFLHIFFLFKLLELIEPSFFNFDFTKELVVFIFSFFYIVLGIRYMFFFNPKKFEEKLKKPPRYKMLFIYTVFFLIMFFFIITI